MNVDRPASPAGVATVFATAFLLVLPFVARASPRQGQGTVRGRIVHATTGRPVKAPSVLLEEAPALASRVQDDGSFVIENVPPGDYHLLAVAPGFTALRTVIQVPGTPPLELALVPEVHYTEVVSVSGTPRDQFVAYQPTTVLAGQDLTLNLEGSLGAALDDQPGVAQRSFGPAASRPVIRGLDGDRVLVLEDGQRTGDLSSQSGDHGATVNPAAATRLEIVRGPAALLYGASAIGGLVNVIHDQVPPTPYAGWSGSAIADAGTAASEGGGAADVNWGNGRWAFRGGAAGRGAGDVDTPEGTIANTQSRSALTHVGVSRTADNGYLGASYGYSDMRYGVPVIEEGRVELTPRRHSVTVKGERRGMQGIVDGLRGSAAYRRYRHEEVVAGDPETSFKNDSVEFDLLATHRAIGRSKGTLGGSASFRSFASSGAEALSPPVDQGGLALFMFEEFTWPHVTVQVGGRYDRAAFDVDSAVLPDRTFNNASGSIGFLTRPNEVTTIAISLARTARNPALEELYFFGPHPGNYAFEIGNPRLTSEKALGLDVSFRWRLPRASGDVTYFRNDIADYIFRMPVSEEEFDAEYGDAGAEHAVDDDHEGHAHGDYPIVAYVGADSLLQGLEAHADFDLTRGLSAELGVDYTRGELTGSGDPLPRMPPLRARIASRYQKAGFQVGGEVMAVAEQDRVYPGETPTPGYTLLELFGAWSFEKAGLVNTITVRLDNVTNQLYRNHLSLIKDLVPEMGRNLKVVYRMDY